jgi:5'-nucleotidase
MTDRIRVLITNDDGVGSAGIRWLVRAAVEHGLDVLVAAPAEEASGSSAALSAVEEDGRVLVSRHTLDGLDGVQAHGVAASPAFIALLAVRGAFGPPPDVVLSGVNRGANAGRGLLHSGTVGAALTAAAHGRRAMAVSLNMLFTADAADDADDERWHWPTAARTAIDLLPALIAAPRGTVLNVNVPDVPLERLRGVRRARLATFGLVQMTVVEAGEGFVRTALEETGTRPEAGTDIALLAEGFATVTAIRALMELPGVSLPGDGQAGTS